MSFATPPESAMALSAILQVAIHEPSAPVWTADLVILQEQGINCLHTHIASLDMT